MLHRTLCAAAAAAGDADATDGRLASITKLPAPHINLVLHCPLSAATAAAGDAAAPDG